MIKLSDKQANVIYHNARFLDLTSHEEYLLNRVAHIELLPSEASDVIGNIIEYIKSDNEKAKDALRNDIREIIVKYKSQLEQIL